MTTKFGKVSNTSSLKLSEMIQDLPEARQKLCMVGHWYNPAYPEAKFLAFLQTNGIHFLMRCKRKWNCAVDETQSNDFTLRLSRDLSLRVVRVLLPSGETETLITDLFDLPYEQFMPLYFRRRPVEGKFDILKNKLELCNFTGCFPNAIRQDF